jgi:hypothetical protein
MMPSCIVSVDFVEAIMSDELIHIVENWYKSRRKVVIEGKFIECEEERGRIIIYFSIFLFTSRYYY